MRSTKRMLKTSVVTIATALSVSVVTTSVAVGLDARSVVAGPSAAPSGLIYTVVKGDSLSGIAAKLGVPMADLLAVNGLKRTSVIHPGTTLQVPKGGALPAGATGSNAVYTVVKGDSLIRVANRLGVTLAQLLETNHLTKQSVIVPGRQLAVPAGGSLPTPAAQPTTNANQAPTPAATPAPAAPSGQRYVVRKGDGLTRIALRLGVSLTDLLRVNGMQRHSVIHPGMELQVPAGGHLPPDASAAPPASDKVGTVIAFARNQLGEPYRFNAAGPDSWDCSGLTLMAYAQVGVKLPHYSAAQAKLGTAVNWTRDGIQAGDLVFLETSPGSGVIGHVGLAISPTQWIQAPRAGDVVRISNIPSTRIVAVKRFV